jgi:tubby-related protein 1
MTSPFFLLDDASSSRTMSMSDRQSQLVLQRRQIIRQNSRVNSNHSTGGGAKRTNGSFQKEEESDYGDNNFAISSPTTIHDRAMCSPDHQVEGIAVHSPSELSCTSTAIKHTRGKEESNDESKSNDSCNKSDDADKENEEALHRLKRELENKNKELEETRSKLEEADRLKAELDQLRNEKDSRQRKKLQLQKSTAVDVQDDSKLAHHDGSKLNEIVITTYSSGGSVVGGSDSGYQRYLDAFHQPKKPVLSTRQQSDATSDISNLTGSIRLSSTSSSRPLSRVRHSQESSSSLSLATATTPTMMLSSSTPVPTKKPTSSESAERANDQEQHSTISDSQRRESSINRSLPSLQQQLTSIASANLDDPVVMRSILMNPCPKDGGMVQCCIRRNKGMNNTFGLFPEYRCYLRGNNNSRTETFLMTSKKRAGKKTSNYLISMGRNDHDKDSNNILGKLRANFFDTEYVLFDNGKNPDDCRQDGKNDGGDDVRVELGAMLIASHSSMGTKGPRTINFGISNVDEEGNAVKLWRPLHKRDESMLDCLKTGMEEEASSSMDKQHLLIHLQSKAPAWDEALQRFFLNFNGRVTMASVKNFQLVDGKGNMCLQFGRTGKDEFILDVQWPLSPFQAFAVALSSFDSKVGCD